MKRSIQFITAFTVIVLPSLVFGVTRDLPPITPGLDSIGDFFQALLRIATQIGVPIGACCIVWAGYQFVTAQGDVKKLQSAKDMLLWTIIGLTILLGAWVVVSIIQATIDQLK